MQSGDGTATSGSLAHFSSPDPIAELRMFVMECGRSRGVLQIGLEASTRALARGLVTYTGLSARQAQDSIERYRAALWQQVRALREGQILVEDGGLVGGRHGERPAFCGPCWSSRGARRWAALTSRKPDVSSPHLSSRGKAKTPLRMRRSYDGEEGRQRRSTRPQALGASGTRFCFSDGSRMCSDCLALIRYGASWRSRRPAG